MRALSIALLAISCKPVDRIEQPIPDSITWYAVISMDGDRVAHASELTRRAPGEPLIAVDRPGFDTLILAWEDDPALSAGALRAPAPCEPALPEPAVLLRWSEELAVLATTEAPAVTTDAFAAGCPDLDPSTLSADLSCVEERCRVSIVPTGRCTFTLDTGACGGPTFAAGLDAGDQVCLRAREPWSCEGIACSAPDRSCEVEIHRRPDPPFEAAMLALPGEPYLPFWVSMFGQLRAESRIVGIATDLIELGERLVIYSAGEPLEDCSNRTPDGELLFVDPDRLEITHTATAPPCVYRIAALQERFAAVHREGEGLAISLFDATGSRIRTAPTDPRLTYWIERTLAMLVVDDRLWVLFGGSGGNALLLDFDPITLAAGELIDLGSPRIWSMVDAGDGHLALLEAAPPAVSWLELASAQITRHVLPWPASPHDFDTTFDAAMDPIHRRLIATGSQPPAAFALELLGAPVARSIIHDSDAEPIAIAHGPEPGQMLVAGSLVEPSGERIAVLSTYDVAGARFLSGSHRIGPTFASKLLRARDGRYFALLPWTPAIVRIGWITK